VLDAACEGCEGRMGGSLSFEEGASSVDLSWVYVRTQSNLLY
jgi:hypothetical protein